MKPWRTLATAASGLILRARDGEFVIYTGAHLLMTSRAHRSERELATVGCAKLIGVRQPRVLIGGLGMGYTLRACLDLLPSMAAVVVAEISPAVVDWNRTLLADLAERPLDDGRAQVRIEDVQDILRHEPNAFDAILLDVDNGPAALAQKSNRTLYQKSGLNLVASSLRESGRVVFWSAKDDPGFLRAMKTAGFTAEAHAVPPEHGGGATHTLFVGDTARSHGTHREQLRARK